ncbi:ninjurin-2-like [Sabethes cyaneus]|uniref:ninjurin-2-like n=1 Tax=Sabethes cyaneus TaxID=53552 RepID=UPI00237DC375|nr:ninjurin-2-like [Sabethes cyaneus]
MENRKYTREEFFDLSNERLLQNPVENKTNTKSFKGQPLLNEIDGSELISKPAELSSSSTELVRYHSVVELDENDDDFDSCKDSTDNVNQRPKIGWHLAQPELSNFVQKKSIAQGMMDLALVSANTNQLRYVIDIGQRHPYFYTSMALIITSLVMQLIVGLALIYNSRFNIRKKREMQSADRINDLSVIGVFLITLVNVFISTFNGSNSDLYSAEATAVSSDVTNSALNMADPQNGTISSMPANGVDGI